MRNKATATLIALFLLLVMGANLYVKIQLRTLHAQVSTHLQQQGYKPEEIASSNPRFSKQPVFGIDVIFQDEPRVVYTYANEKGTLVQKYHTTIYNCSYKHAEN